MDSNNNVKKVEYKQTDRGVVPVYADEIIENQKASYSPNDNKVWNILITRQKEHIKHTACSPYLSALNEISFTENTIPDLDFINNILLEKTSWKTIMVNGLLSDVVFFNQLSQRKFPVTWWIRSREKLDYIQEPDIFHDLFGHVPLLLNPSYARVMQKFGEAGSGKYSEDPVFMEKLARLYWFSIEFGLMDEGDGIKIFGAGLLSSQGEVNHALGDDCKRKPLDFKKVVKTPYKIDSYQPLYYVLKDFDEIENELDKLIQSQG